MVLPRSSHLPFFYVVDFLSHLLALPSNLVFRPCRFQGRGWLRLAGKLYKDDGENMITGQGLEFYFYQSFHASLYSTNLQSYFPFRGWPILIQNLQNTNSSPKPWSSISESQSEVDGNT